MYFRDMEDLFHYLMEESINEMLMVFEEVLHSQGGDIFAALPAMYDHLQAAGPADRSLGGMGYVRQPQRMACRRATCWSFWTRIAF